MNVHALVLTDPLYQLFILDNHYGLCQSGPNRVVRPASISGWWLTEFAVLLRY